MATTVPVDAKNRSNSPFTGRYEKLKVLQIPSIFAAERSEAAHYS
jgi:hypothetical protein